ncbi:alpha beta hydrolase [Diplodia corticola]|uniref:Alpha beta hydrolase n=1 Tax=Diplodia corticola TaxID=236234 RepID=A0A1J9RKI4_9PEZI|nr:alpha beta hydrolase [Diplodia corticola]OJD33099.1 alpha beta hydrolase [Diplodia corticola]
MPAAFFTHAGSDLFYVVEGTGAPVLLLHGWTCDHLDWSWQQPFLQDLGFQTIALDLPGHGRSAAPPPPDPLVDGPTIYSPEALADAAAALLSHLGITDAIVLGHSLGTVLTSALAVRHPRAVRAIVLVDPVYYLPGPQLDPFVAYIDQPDAPTRAVAFFEQAFYTDTTPAWLKAWHRHRTLGNHPLIVRAVIRELYGKQESIGRRENALVYNRGRSGKPRFVACADQGKVDLEYEIGVDEATDRVELIEEGHWLHQQDAETFNKKLRSWLEAQGYLPE